MSEKQIENLLIAAKVEGETIGKATEKLMTDQVKLLLNATRSQQDLLNEATSGKQTKLQLQQTRQEHVTMPPMQL